MRTRILGGAVAVAVVVGTAAAFFAVGLVVGWAARFSNPLETAVVWALFVLGPGVPVGILWGWTFAPAVRSGGLPRHRLGNQAMLASLAGSLVACAELTVWSAIHRPADLSIDLLAWLVGFGIFGISTVIAAPIGWLVAYPATHCWRALVQRLAGDGSDAAPVAPGDRVEVKPAAIER